MESLIWSEQSDESSIDGFSTDSTENVAGLTSNATSFQQFQLITNVGAEREDSQGFGHTTLSNDEDSGFEQNYMNSTSSFLVGNAKDTNSPEVSGAESSLVNYQIHSLRAIGRKN